LYVEGLRKRKEYDELQHSERSDRSKQFRGFVDDLSKRLKVPKDQLYENQYTMPPNQLLQLDGSIRNQMRAIDGVKIPCENTLSKLKMELAVTHGTMTGEFLRGGLMGAYMSDPLTFLQSVSTRSQFLCIGGDAGNGVSKLGVTYTNRRGKQKFQPLLVYAGKDDWESLEKLKHEPGEEPLTPFFGATRLAQLSGHSINDIWDLFQYVKDTCRKPVYLNGDMAFLLAVQGCKTASSLNPCPICIVAADKTRSDALRLSQQLLEPAAPRRPELPVGKHSKEHKSLLFFSPDEIVPLPLHILLGLCNRIISETYAELLGAEKLKAAWDSVKSTPAWKSGVADIFGLNGPELRRWERRDIIAPILNELKLSRTQRKRAEKCQLWISGLHRHLLHARNWTDAEVSEFTSLVASMQSEWTAVTNTTVTPKVHMLTHAVEWVKRHRRLGVCSEAQIESYHARFTRIMNDHIPTSAGIWVAAWCAHSLILLLQLPPK